MTDYLASADLALLKRHGLDNFEALWALQLDAVDEPNTGRGGWSSVFRLELEGKGYYLKRQSDYLTRTLHRPFGEPTFAREFRNISRYQKLRIPALLPESYIPDVNLRLSCYKKLASARNTDELDEVQVELIDRFGLLPDAAKNLVALSEFKLQAQQLGIRRIEANSKGGVVEFGDKTAVSPAYIIELIQKQSRVFKLEGGQKLRFNIASNDGAQRLELIASMLSDFASHKVAK